MSERTLSLKCDERSFTIIDRSGRKFPRPQLIEELEQTLCKLVRLWELTEEYELYVYTCSDRISLLMDILWLVIDGRYDIIDTKGTLYRVPAIAVEWYEGLPPVVAAVVLWTDRCFIVTPIE